MSDTSSVRQDVISLIAAVDGWLAPCRWLAAARAGAIDPANADSIPRRWLTSGQWSQVEFDAALVACSAWRAAKAGWPNGKPPDCFLESVMFEVRAPAGADVLRLWPTVARAMEHECGALSSVPLRHVCQHVEREAKRFPIVGFPAEVDDDLPDWPGVRLELAAFADRVDPPAPPGERKKPERRGPDPATLEGVRRMEAAIEDAKAKDRPRPTIRRLAKLADLSEDAARKNLKRYGKNPSKD